MITFLSFSQYFTERFFSSKFHLKFVFFSIFGIKKSLSLDKHNFLRSDYNCSAVLSINLACWLCLSRFLLLLMWHAMKKKRKAPASRDLTKNSKRDCREEKERHWRLDEIKPQHMLAVSSLHHQKKTFLCSRINQNCSIFKFLFLIAMIDWKSVV